MFGLSLEVCFGHQRTPQPIPRIHQVEEALALSHPYLHAVALVQAGGEAFAIPEIGLQSGGRGRLPHQVAHLLQLLGGEPRGAAGVIALGQAG